MKFNWKLCSVSKKQSWIVKLATVVLLTGLAFRLFVFRSTGFEPQVETSLLDKAELLKQDVSVAGSSVDETDVHNSPANFDLTSPDLQPVEVPNPEDQIPHAGNQPDVQPVEVPNSEDQIPHAGNQPDVQPVEVLNPEDQIPRAEKCDLFTGDWIPNQSGPLYTNESCSLIESPQNCMKNGRPDSEYLYWRWNPHDCELPPFDAKRFLELMRNKAWALIGDSISRNHVQSLLCMLSTVERPVEVYHDEEYKSKRWHFTSYNFTISNIWSPFLVKAAIFEDNNGVSTSEVQLHLDILDKNWTSLYPTLDYAIISTGKWFLKAAIYHENNTVAGCHICPKGNLKELGFDFAYRKALQYTLDFIATSENKGPIFFRTSTPDHFENGEWHNGGSCQRTTPAKEGEIELKVLVNILRNIELEEFEKAAEKAAKNGVNLKLLDFTNLSLTRPDGHPGPYRQFQPFAKDKNAKVQNDCLHWCLPGPIDSWNDVIMEMTVNRVET